MLSNIFQTHIFKKLYKRLQIARYKSGVIILLRRYTNQYELFTIVYYHPASKKYTDAQHAIMCSGNLKQYIMFLQNQC